MIRARFRLYGRVKTITAEAKWSGVFLSLFPIFAFLGLTLFRPDYFDQVKAAGLYGTGFAIVATLMVINVIVMRHLVNVKI